MKPKDETILEVQRILDAQNEVELAQIMSQYSDKPIHKAVIYRWHRKGLTISTNALVKALIDKIKPGEGK